MSKEEIFKNALVAIQNRLDFIMENDFTLADFYTPFEKIDECRKILKEVLK